MFVDSRYHLPFLSQAELARAEGDEGLSVYLIPLRGPWDDARVGARVGRDPVILGSCQSSRPLKRNQYHQAPRQPNLRRKGRLISFGGREKGFSSGNTKRMTKAFNHSRTSCIVSFI